MKLMKTWGAVASLAIGLAFVGCSSSDDDAAAVVPVVPESTTYSVTGNLAQSASASSTSINAISKLRSQMAQSKVNGFSSDTRTQCADGFFYSVFCLSYSSLTAEEGKVDCTNGGAFEVAGLPKGEAIGCFVHRLETADGAVGGDSMVGAIQIPASNLNGSTEQMVSSGDVDLAVTIGANGTITAQVVSGTPNETIDSGAATNFTAANMNGVWELKCNSTATGAAVVAGACKCFLGDLASAGYTGQDGEKDCLADGGAGFTGDVALGIGLYVYGATVNNDLVVHEDSNTSIPAGSTINAISIWGTSGTGPYVSAKTGGEGASNLGGDLTWLTTPDDPTAAVDWATSVDPGNGAIAIGAVPAIGANHGAWITWAQNIMISADAAANEYDCSRPNTVGDNPQDNIWCLNEVLERISNVEGASLPRVYFLPYCDQNGCHGSIDTDHTDDYMNADAFKKARMEIRGLRFPYPNDWQLADDNSALVSEVDGIGLESEMRFVFEPLEFFPGGAGFRQSEHDERHYRCGSSQHDVQNAACDDAMDYYELRCFVRKELSIKFLGSGNTAPINVVFDDANTVGHAELIKHGAGEPLVVTPTGTTAIKMCALKGGNNSAIFTATATKQ